MKVGWGAHGGCANLLLMAPTRDAMQNMLDTCQRFAVKYNLQFSTDTNPEKSKLAFAKLFKKTEFQSWQITSVYRLCQ